VTIRAATASPDQVVEQLVKRVTEDPALMREFMSRLTAITTTSTPSKATLNLQKMGLSLSVVGAAERVRTSDQRVATVDVPL
jgi:hypothetical protein